MSDTRSGREIRAELAKACAIAFGIGSKMSLLELNELILKRGLPSPEALEVILAARLADDEVREWDATLADGL